MEMTPKKPMTRCEASKTLLSLAENDLFSEEVKAELTEIAHCICADGFAECSDTSPHCEGCTYLLS